MRQNIYDDPTFFANYQSYRLSDISLNKRIEQPAINALLPALRNLCALDLGCGFGEFCASAIAAGARRVVGLDCSVRMCRKTKALCMDRSVEVINQFVEDATFTDEFDVVVSSLMLHYVQEIDEVFRKIVQWVAPGGQFIFSVNHPMYSAALGIAPQTVPRYGGGLTPEYFDEGPREHCWLGGRVLKYHRTLETYFNGLTAVGFQIDTIREPAIPIEVSQRLHPLILATTRWPVFLIIRAQRIK